MKHTGLEITRESPPGSPALDREENLPAVPEQWPLVSVLIPVRNEAHYIGNCLGALRQTSYPRGRLEILVIDGESDDSTLAIVERFRGDGLPIRVLRNQKRQRCAGLNLGVAAARGDIILRLDARNLAPADYITRCVSTLLATDASNVGGVVEPVYETTTQQAIGLAMSHPFGVGNAAFRLGRGVGPVESVYLGCLRRDVFARVGLFDESARVISEDSDLNQRIRQAGGRLHLDSAIHIFYYPRENFWSLSRLYFRYGGARASFILKHGKPIALRQLVPVTALGIGTGLGVLSLFHPAFFLSGVSLVALYATCDLAVSGILSFRHKKMSLLPRLLMAFPCMHVSYACGFLRRLAQRPKPGSYWGF